MVGRCLSAVVAVVAFKMLEEVVVAVFGVLEVSVVEGVVV